MQTKFSLETKQKHNILIDCNRNRRRTVAVARCNGNVQMQRKAQMDDERQGQATTDKQHRHMYLARITPSL